MQDNQALIIIDMQHGLLNKEVLNKASLVSNINSLLDSFHSLKKPVFIIRHTNTSYSKENSEDWQICGDLRTSNTDILFNKKQSSVFKEKGFLSMLKDKNLTSVVIVGLVSNGCVQAACSDANKMGFSVVLISDAHSTFSKDAENVIQSWNVRLENEGINLYSTTDFIKNI